MNKQARDEVREMLHDILSGYQALNISNADVINNSLVKIENHLSKINGTVAEHTRIIISNLPHTIAHCPQVEDIEELKKNMVSSKDFNELRDNMTTTKAIKRFIYTSIAATGTFFSILFILYKIFIEKL